MLHTLIGVAIAALLWPLINQAKKLGLTQWWCKHLLGCFNIQVTTSGQRPPVDTRATMFVANHISWSDIHVINSVIPLQFIAKLEIKDWPIFGYLVKKTGTVFIDRTNRKDAVRIVEIASSHLKNGDNLGFFPEGTTTDGTHMVKFKSSVIQAPIAANAIVWPIAIHYPMPNGSANTQMAYANNTTLIESMMNVIRLKNPVVSLHFLAPISTHQSTRQAVTKAAFDTISKQLNF
ncbi:MAG: lysophospholipid acyltransferase family protein [Methylophilaceae bacterium]